MNKDQDSYHSTFCEEWSTLFNQSNSANLVAHLKDLCLKGRLQQGSHFRSVCWKILLGCLCPDKTKWLDDAACSRKCYENLKTKYNVDPRKCNGGDKECADLDLNNPLSLNSESLWRQYFLDVELCAYIRQDVERTFPELSYFQSDRVRNVMIQILFIFARENEYLSYKQGMHEILGPLLFVLYSDQQSLDHALELNDLKCCFDAGQNGNSNTIVTLIDHRFLEHDAYHMFVSIMHTIKDWYCYPVDRADKKIKRRPSIAEILFLSDAERQKYLYSKERNMEASSPLVQKLNSIESHLLRSVDPVLYNHLQTLDIPPQIFGIRWLRLLFGREFPIQDLLYLWDAIFAFGVPFSLVDYIFVAMLCFIRDLLLSSDYTGCLQYLMRYPPVADVHSLLRFALHLLDPQTYTRPALFLTSNFSHITVSGQPHPNMEQVPPPLNRPIERQVGPKLGQSNRNASLVDLWLKKVSPDEGLHFERQNTSLHSSIRRPVTNRTSHPARSKSKEITEEDLELLKEQVSCLQYRLNEVEHASKQAAIKMLSIFDKVDERLKVVNVVDDEDLSDLMRQIRQICISIKGPDLCSKTRCSSVGQKINNEPSENRAEKLTSFKEHTVEIAREATVGQCKVGVHTGPAVKHALGAENEMTVLGRDKR